MIFSHKNNPYFIIIVFLILLFPSQAISFPDAQKVFRENNKAVVVVVTFDKQGKPISQGSGFVVRQDGAIVTNYHVISNAAEIRIKAGDKILKVEGLIHTDKENDLVILKADGKKLPIVKIGDMEKINVGEKVYVIGNPEGLENTISDGILSGIRETEPKRKILQITAPISKGSSGGPVFNKNGEVIGIATFLIEEAQNLNFAMPVNLIKDKISIQKVTGLKDAGIKDYKKDAEYWVVLGKFYLQSGSYREAIESYTQAIKIKPEDAYVHCCLGLAYDHLGMHREAVESYKQSIRLKPDDAYVAYVYFFLGVAYGMLDMNREAIESYTEAIRIEPDNAVTHFSLGGAYAKLGMYREAVKSFKQAIRLKPDNAQAHYNIGIVYTLLGMYREAIESYKQAIRIKPDYAEANNNLGKAYAELGRHREAVDSYKQAIRIKPDYAEAYTSLGYAYIKLGMNWEAIESYRLAIRIKPDDAAAHFYLGITYLMLNDRGSALEEYKILKYLDSERANKLFSVIYE